MQGYKNKMMLNKFSSKNAGILVFSKMTSHVTQAIIFCI